MCNYDCVFEEAGNKLNRISEQMLQLTGSCTELQIQNSSLTQELALTKGDMLAKTREVERLTKQLEDKSQKMEVANESLSEIKAEKANLVNKKKFALYFCFQHGTKFLFMNWGVLATRTKN